MKTLRRCSSRRRCRSWGSSRTCRIYICPHCGERDELFGHGGAADAARDLKVPFLGEIPLDVAIRRNADEGTPVVLAAPEAPSGRAMGEIAGRLAQQISIQAFRQIPLTIAEE